MELSKLKVSGMAALVGAQMSNQDWLFILSIIITVLGMIQTFEVISVFGTGNPRAMASGISVALITTQTGLLVAIPGLLMSNRLGRMAQGLRTNLDEAAAALVRGLANQGGSP